MQTNLGNCMGASTRNLFDQEYRAIPTCTSTISSCRTEFRRRSQSLQCSNVHATACETWRRHTRFLKCQPTADVKHIWILYFPDYVTSLLIVSKHSPNMHTQHVKMFEAEHLHLTLCEQSTNVCRKCNIPTPYTNVAKKTFVNVWYKTFKFNWRANITQTFVYNITFPFFARMFATKTFVNVC